MTSQQQQHQDSNNAALNANMTPPMAEKASSRSPSVESDFDESYFERTYVPLSNLPTPPLSHPYDRVPVADTLCSVDEYRNPELLGPAIHLSNLTPTSVSLTNASIPLLHSILTRTSLPLRVIALSVLVLDSLTPRFSLSFRTSCPLSFLQPPYQTSQHNNPTPPVPIKQRVDDLHPELIPLCALMIADKFLDDRHSSTKQYAKRWGRDIWSCEQINHAEKCVLVDLKWRVLELWREDMVTEALGDMRRAGNMERQRGRWARHGHDDAYGYELGRHQYEEGNGIGIGGRAVTGIDGQTVTPADTPTDENIKSTAAWIIDTQKELYAENTPGNKDLVYQWSRDGVSAHAEMQNQGF